jgi:hypothetical protein
MKRSYERRATHRKKGNFGEVISEMVEVKTKQSHQWITHKYESLKS